MPKPCHDRHPDPAADCRICWLAANDPRYQRLWGLPVTAPPREPVPRVKSKSRVRVRKVKADPAAPPKPPRRSLPCIHLGAPVRGPAAPDARRDWRTCDKGHGVVCRCGACKTCSDYEPDGEPQEKP